MSEKNNNLVRQLQFNETQSRPVVVEKKKPFQERAGDWVCSRCRNLNFSFRLICNRCQLTKKDSIKLNDETSEIQSV